MLYDKPEQLEGKKVLLRIIATDKEKKEANKSEEIRSNLKDAYNSFVGMISDSTNLQTKIEEADRRSNLLIQREMQKRIFDYYGLLYERKKGEFEEAIELITSGKVDVKKILTKTVSMDEAPETIIDIEKNPGNYMKVVVDLR